MKMSDKEEYDFSDIGLLKHGAKEATENIFEVAKEIMEETKLFSYAQRDERMILFAVAKIVSEYYYDNSAEEKFYLDNLKPFKIKRDD